MKSFINHTTMDYKVNQTLNHFTIDVAPAKMICPLADFLSDQGMNVVEARIIYGLNQGVIILYVPCSGTSQQATKEEIEQLCKRYETKNS